jgi:hypothetical protein
LVVQEAFWKFDRLHILNSFNILIIIKIVKTWKIGQVTLPMIINSIQNSSPPPKEGKGDSGFKKDSPFATCAQVGTRC